jgi:glycosyltransferase involved in cell wall biosynthesis
LTDGRGAAARGATTNLPVRLLAPGETIGADRGSVVVCLHAAGAKQPAADSLASLLAWTAAEVSIVLVGPPAGTTIRAGEGTTRREIVAVEEHPGDAFPKTCNEVFAATEPADVILIAAGTVVAADWCERLRAAAYADSHFATASALSNLDGLLAVPLSGSDELGPGAAAVAAGALCLRPRLPSAVGPCVYIRRDAIDIAGSLDTGIEGRDAALVDFSQRTLQRGLLHVAADDVLVWAEPATTTRSKRRSREPSADAAAIARRYPYYERERENVERSVDRPVHLATRRALRALRRPAAGTRLSVTVDGRVLGPVLAGTQIDTLETVTALARTGELALTVAVPFDLGRHAREVLGDAGVTLVRSELARERTGVADVVFRPYQVSRVDDLSFLRPLGERIVMSCLDLIAFHNPGYFPAYPHWRRYQASTRIALALADHVVFSTHDCADEAVAERLIEPERLSVVYRGVNHQPSNRAPRRPRGLERLRDRPYLLCLGADYRHKNRVFALELVAAMRDIGGWEGAIVLAGPQLEIGSSRDEEAAYLGSDSDLAERTVVLGQVSEAEKHWLLEHCAAVCYPTTREGFGFMPFEAAAAGRPCIFAASTSLGELLPGELATITPWDPAATAQRVLALLGDGDAVAEQVRAINAVASGLTWERNAQGLLDAFHKAAGAATRDGSRFADDLRDLAADEAEIERKYNELWGGLSSAGKELVGPDGLLGPEDQRALLMVSRRPLLRRLILWPARLLRSLRRRPAPAVDPPSTDPEEFSLHFGFTNRLHMREQLARMPELDDLD